MTCTLYSIVGYFEDGTVWRHRHTTSFAESLLLTDNMVNTARDWLADGNERMRGVTVKVYVVEEAFEKPVINIPIDFNIS